MYIHIYTYIHTYIRKHIHIHTYTHMHTYREYPFCFGASCSTTPRFSPDNKVLASCDRTGLCRLWDPGA